MISPVHFLVLLALCVVSSSAQCETSILSDHQKILLVKNNEILLPSDDTGKIMTAPGDKIKFACPSSYLEPLGSGYDLIEAECVENRTYKYRGIDYDAKILQCYMTPSPTDKAAGKCISNKYTAIDIGFQKTDSRAGFRIGNFFTSELADKYTESTEKITLSDILAGGIGFPTYFKANNLLQIGHLIAKCDFVYVAQQQMTFYYINAAPQFASFNIRNWRMVEDKIRRLVKSEKTDLELYTGTYGVLKLPDTSSRQVPLYLNYKSRTSTYQIPVPEFFWKVVIQRKGTLTLALAILGMNDVYFFNPTTIPCPNVLSLVTWLNIPRWNSVGSGYIIACEVSEFVKISGLKDQLPDFPTIHGNLY